MSLTLKAPNEDRVVLPDPEFGDERNHIATTLIHRMQDSSYRTIIKTTGKKAQRLSFDVQEKKAEEFFSFYTNYSAEKFVVTSSIPSNVLDGTYYITNNPIQENIGRAVNATSKEKVTFNLELREV